MYAYNKPDTHHYILSLSAQVNIQLLWSYYAGGHTGIAFGFDFSEDPLFSKQQFLAVEYREETVETLFEKLILIHNSIKEKSYAGLPYPDEMNQYQHYTQKIMTLKFGFKQKTWKHEEEKRFIASDLKALPGKAMRFEVSTLKYIVLGAKISNEDREKILSRVAQPHFSHVEIHETHIDHASDQLHFTQLK